MTWHAKTTGSYDPESTEARENAMEMYGVLNSLGWTVNAVSGLLGNIHVESHYNPWRYQSDDVQSFVSSQTWELGYGLVQFSPCRKYLHNPQTSGYTGFDPNFSDRQGQPWDGMAQCYAIDGLPGQWIPTSSYPMSYAEFKSSTGNPGDLAMAFLLNYERPGDPSATETTRREMANYWYQYLSGQEPPGPGPGPGPGPEPPPVYGDTFPRGMGWKRLRFGKRRIRE